MKVKRNIIYGLIITAGVVLAGISSFFIISSLKPNQAPIQDPFDTKIENLMAEYEIPSLAAGIVINETLVWENGYGNQSDLDTVYMIGSITKTFTATAILQLNESNLLNLDDNISDYIPFTVRHPDYPNIPITTRMLLTHTAGLQTNLYWSLEYYFNNQTIDWINDNLGWGIIAFSHRPTLEEFLNGSLNPLGPYYNDYNWYQEPGKEFHYSNAGFQLLGYLVEQITNQSLEEYVQENIFNPLNMSHSGYFYEDFIDNHAIPYEWSDNANLELPLYNMNVTGAGSIRSTISDMVKYMIAFMNQGRYNKTQLLSPESVTLMLSSQVIRTGTSTEGFTNKGYGLGWCIYESGYKGHGGATPGFSANMWIKLSSRGSFGGIVMFNRGSALIYDYNLINSFIPEINKLLLIEAGKLFY